MSLRRILSILPSFILPWLILLWFILFCALPLAAAAPVGNPADFAALTIRPNGPEELDLTTGVTTLPQGGTVAYKAEGVTLSGTFIRYLEGQFIEVEEATVQGTFGTLTAPSLRFDVAAQRLEAAQGAHFEGEALRLGADKLSLNLTDDVATLSGNVSSQNPELTSQTALVDTTGSQALLLGPYSFQNGPVSLTGDAGKRLALRWDDAGDVSAETRVPPEVQQRFAAYLP